MTQGTEITRRLGRYTTAHSPTSIYNATIGDGTVPKAATNVKHPETIDPDTGRVSKRKHDPVAILHTQGGDEQVVGTKFVMMWSPGWDKHSTVALGIDYCTAPSPADEAKVAIALDKKIQATLKREGRASAITIYDRAAAAAEQNELNAVGKILHTRAIGDHLDPDSGSRYLEYTHIAFITPPCGHAYQLVARMKRLHVALDGVGVDVAYVATDTRTHAVFSKKAGRYYHCSHHTWDCHFCEGRRHEVVIPWTGSSAAEKAPKNPSWSTKGNVDSRTIGRLKPSEHKAITIHLQPEPPDSSEGEHLLGIRERAEGAHARLDDLLPFQRLQRWAADRQRSLDSKLGYLAGYLSGHNHVVAALNLSP